MGEQVLQFITDAISTLALSVASVLAGPTIMLLLLKHFVPTIGNPLWQWYCQALVWCVAAPVRLVRVLIREAMGRRH
jgi:hypothetical protein